MKRDERVIRLRSFGGPWSLPNSKEEDVVVVDRSSIWIGTRKGGMSIHGRVTMKALADAIYDALGLSESAPSETDHNRP